MASRKNCIAMHAEVEYSLNFSKAGSSMAAEKVGEFPASGIFFKDSVQTLAIDDPEVQGVTIYISGEYADLSSS